MGRLDGKIAIITGAARGQGATEARRFVSEGARVLVTDVLPEGAEVASELGDAGCWAALDVTDEQQWRAALEICVKVFGAPSVLVNNAGVVQFASLLEMPTAEFRRVLEVNLVGTFLGIRTVAPAMARAGGGSIVNISSTAGLTGFPAVGAYAASKHGVTGLTRSAAMELGPVGIRVNSVHPGSIETPMVMLDGLTVGDFAPFYERLPIKRLGQPIDVANMVLFLASDESSYCTGGAYVVDGGQTCGDHGVLSR